MHEIFDDFDEIFRRGEQLAILAETLSDQFYEISPNAISAGFTVMVCCFYCIGLDWIGLIKLLRLSAGGRHIYPCAGPGLSSRISY